MPFKRGVILRSTPTRERHPKMSLLELFCAVDDFWQAFEPVWRQQQLTSGERQRGRASELSESEMMTIVIHFHQARYRDFKAYYTQHVQVFLGGEFPTLISYGRFSTAAQSLATVVRASAKLLRSCHWDCLCHSTALAVCDNRRITATRFFSGLGSTRENLNGLVLWL